jgi:serpin B
VLTGAVYFDAAWASPFPAAATTSQSFHALDGSTRPVPTMKQQDLGGWFAQGDGWTYLSVPYAGGEVAFDLVLPDAGRFAEIEGKIDLTQLDLMRAALQPDTGTLSLPRFSVAGQTFSVKRALTDLGMGVAFSDSADFSGITSGADLMLDDMLHQALVKVDEQGTEAAAASAAIVVDESFNPGSFQVTVDRPFVFFIRDVQTSTLLFAGRVVTLG